MDKKIDSDILHMIGTDVYIKLMYKFPSLYYNFNIGEHNTILPTDIDVLLHKLNLSGIEIKNQLILMLTSQDNVHPLLLELKHDVKEYIHSKNDIIKYVVFTTIIIVACVLIIYTSGIYEKLTKIDKTFFSRYTITYPLNWL
jgi:hypothetical protein